MKIIDQIYECELPGEVFGLWHLKCHLQIFKPHPEVQTVMITNMGFEMGWFIPYLVERLIEQVVKEFHLEPNKLTWIEHYTTTFKKPTCADFSQVIFDWTNGQATNPRWTAIAPQIAQALTNEHLLPV
ncbi:MAG: hypothetical protein NW220_01520 [Leptolyngbyaceae cyanobacterium bins.349]|nr:hypothetical protein [Leptolyngbyaceae cyanobacterium bins.349]